MNLTELQNSLSPPSSKNVADLSNSNDYRTSNPLELFGRIEYCVIDVIGHRLGIKPELELIQADSIRLVIYAAIYGQIKAVLENTLEQNIDDIRSAAGMEIIRKRIHARTNKIRELAQNEAGRIDSNIFLERLGAAMADEELQLLISKVINVEATPETIQEVS